MRAPTPLAAPRKGSPPISSRRTAASAPKVVEHMTVVDASVVVDWVALLTGLRRRRWSGAEADAAYVRLRSLPVRIVDDERDLDRAWDLARRYDDHPIYDMVYVAVAERRGAVLVTADEGLRRRSSTLAWVVGPDTITG